MKNILNENQTFLPDNNNFEDNNNINTNSNFLNDYNIFLTNNSLMEHSNLDESLQNFNQIYSTEPIYNQEDIVNHINIPKSNQNNVKVIFSAPNNDINKQIKLYQFNKKYFNDNYDFFKISKVNVNPYPVKSLRQIINVARDNIDILWSHDFHIFDNELDFLNSEKLELCSNIFNYLNYTKNKTNRKRNVNPDPLLEKIQISLINSSLNYLNNKIKYIIPNNNDLNTILDIEYKEIDVSTKSEFSLSLLKQPLYSIFSNKSNKISEFTNFLKFEKLIELNNNEINNVISIDLQSCLDMFRYTKEDLSGLYINKLSNFIYDEYKKEINKKTIWKYSIKDKMASLLLLVYNYERCLYERLGRSIIKK